MFVWVEVFALIVGLLCACGVRRLYDLMRVCLYFVLFCPLLSSILTFCSCVCLSFYLFAPAFFVCPLVLSLCGLLLLFPFRTMRKKERAQFLASSLVLLWVALFGCCFIFLVLFRCQPIYIVIKFEEKVI